MKRVLILTMAALMILSLAACSRVPASAPEQPAAAAETEAAAEPTPEPAEAPAEESAAERTGYELECDGKSYTVSAGEIGTDKDGHTSVSFYSSKFNTLQFKDGNAYFPIGAYIMVGGSRLDYISRTWTTNYIGFSFSTSEAPEEIYVYPVSDESMAVGIDTAEFTAAP